MNRKERLKRNLGGTARADDARFDQEAAFNGPERIQVRTSIAMPERLLRAVLFSEVERLSAPANVGELRRYFAHFFDATTSEEERESYVTDFQNNPPVVVIGYPRSTGTWPCFAIVLSGDEQNEEALSQYVGETQQEETPTGGEDQTYEGAFFDKTYSIFVMATSPDQCVYLYTFAKLCLLAARDAFVNAGLLEQLHLSGAEVNPNETQLPDIAFARVLTVRTKAIETVPQVLSYRDGRQLRITGLFGSSSVVDGMRGGVNTYAAGEGDDDGT